MCDDCWHGTVCYVVNEYLPSPKMLPISGISPGDPCRKETSMEPAGLNCVDDIFVLNAAAAHVVIFVIATGDEVNVAGVLRHRTS